MKIDQAVNLDDVHKMAKKRLPKLLFDFIEGGTDDELCLERNRKAFQQHQLIPRYLVDVSVIDRSTVLFGRKYERPFGISPTGMAGVFRRDADLMLAEAAAKANIPYLMSSASNASVEMAARVAPHNTWFQLYGARNPEISLDMVKRARDAGIETLVVTVDVPVSSNRERNRRNDFRRPLRLTPSIAMQGLSHPGWLWNYLREGGLPVMGNWAPYAPPGSDANQVADLFGTLTPAPGQTWRVLQDIRKVWPGTLILKGILHPDDARLARDAAVDGIIVSNHGGRQLDCAPSPVDMLAAIRAAVGDDYTLMLDSGVRRGSDIVIARCLGAGFVFFGRPTLYGAVAGGLKGVEKVIEIVSNEIAMVLAQIGCPRIDLLGPEYLAASAADNREAPAP